MFNTVTPDAMSEGSPRMMIIIFLVLSSITTFSLPPLSSFRLTSFYPSLCACIHVYVHVAHFCIALDTLPVLLHTVRGHPGHLHTQPGDDGPEGSISTTIHWTACNLACMNTDREK